MGMPPSPHHLATSSPSPNPLLTISQPPHQDEAAEAAALKEAKEAEAAALRKEEAKAAALKALPDLGLTSALPFFYTSSADFVGFTDMFPIKVRKELTASGSF